MSSRLDRVDALLGGVRRTRREILTPEGVALEVEVATAAERVVALALDLLFMALALVIVLILFVALLQSLSEPAIAFSFILVASFLLRNGYFLHFELTTPGATPGKRIVGLKVIDWRGGPLTAGAVVARNLTREVELFLPLTLLLSLPATAGGRSMTQLLYFGWMAVVSAAPLFNAERRRAGDFLAGTMVIASPRQTLLPDLTQSTGNPISSATPRRFDFTRLHLEAYGAFELQVLEEILRRPASFETDELLRDVCDKICAKIGWAGTPPGADARDFLEAFYAAERAHLEREQLFGRYKEDKTTDPVGPE